MPRIIAGHTHDPRLEAALRKTGIHHGGYGKFNENLRARRSFGDAPCVEPAGEARFKPRLIVNYFTTEQTSA